MKKNIPKLLRLLWRYDYDFFISYKRSEGDIYANALASYLAENSYTCYFDQHIREDNQDNLPASIKISATRSRVLIIIGTSGVKNSKWIPQEIEAFLNSKETKIVLPIAFGNIRDEDWFTPIKRTQIIEEQKVHLHLGNPSKYVKDIIVNSFTFRKRSTGLRKNATITLLSFFILLLSGGLLAMGIISNANSQLSKLQVEYNSTRKKTEKVQYDLTKAKDSLFVINADKTNALRDLGNATKELTKKTAEVVQANRNLDSAELQFRLSTEKGNRLANSLKYTSRAAIFSADNPDLSLLLAAEALHTVEHDSTSLPVADLISRNILSEGQPTIPLYGQGQENKENLAWITSLSMTADNHYVACGDFNGSTVVWELGIGGPPKLKKTLYGTRGPWQQFYGAKIESIEQVRFSKDDSILVTITRGKKLNVWNAKENFELFVKHPLNNVNDIADVAISDDGSMIALLSTDCRTIQVWDLRASTQVPRDVYISSSPVVAFTFSVDGKTLVSWDVVNNVTVLDPISDSKKILALPTENKEKFENSYLLAEEINLYNRIVISPDRHWLITMSKLFDDRVQPQYAGQIWDISANKPLLCSSYPDRRHAISNATFSNNSKWLSISNDRKTSLWDLDRSMPSKEPTDTLVLNEEYWRTAFDPHNNNLAIAEYSSIIVFDLNRPHVFQSFNYLKGGKDASSIEALCFSKDGRWILAGNLEDKAQLWDHAAHGSMFDGIKIDLRPVNYTDIIKKDSISYNNYGEENHDAHYSTIISSPIVSSNLNYVLSGFGDLIELNSGKHLSNIYPKSYYNKKNSLTVSKNREWVVTGISSDSLLLVHLTDSFPHSIFVKIKNLEILESNFLFDNDNKWLAIYNKNKKCADVLSIRNGIVGRSLSVPQYGGTDLSFSNHGNYLLSKFGFSSDTLSGLEGWKISESSVVPLNLSNYSKRMANLTISPSEDWLCASKDYEGNDSINVCWLWHLAVDSQLKQPLIINSHNREANFVFSNDDKFLITYDDLPGDWDKKICVWNLGNPKLPVAERKVNTQRVSISFCRNDGWIIYGRDGFGNVNLATVEGFSDPNRDIELDPGEGYGYDWKFNFSPDNNWFTMAAMNVPMSLWKWGDSNSVRKVDQLSSGSNGIFSSDSTLLVTTDENSTRVWNLGSPKIKYEVIQDKGMPYFDKANKKIIIVNDTIVRKWDYDVGTIFSKIQGAVGRNFTWEEWTQEFPDRQYQKTFEELPAPGSVLKNLLANAESSAKNKDLETARSYYSQAAFLAIENDNPNAANDICWSGCVNGFVNEVFKAGFFAAKKMPTDGLILDTRGLIKALQGDLKGSIADFKEYIDWAKKYNVPNSSIMLRMEWISDLEVGRNPFTEEVLQSLR